jgi:hypothetical protein
MHDLHILSHNGMNCKKNKIKCDTVVPVTKHPIIKRYWKVGVQLHAFLAFHTFYMLTVFTIEAVVVIISSINDANVFQDNTYCYFSK